MEETMYLVMERRTASLRMMSTLMSTHSVHERLNMSFLKRQFRVRVGRHLCCANLRVDVINKSAHESVMPVGIHRFNDHGRHPNDRIGYSLLAFKIDVDSLPR